MTESADARRSQHNVHEFAARLRAVLVDLEPLLKCLTTLRDFGAPAEQALEAVSGMPQIRELRVIWQKWDFLVLSEARSPDALLADHLPPELVLWARLALWGG